TSWVYATPAPQVCLTSYACLSKKVGHGAANAAQPARDQRDATAQIIAVVCGCHLAPNPFGVARYCARPRCGTLLCQTALSHAQGVKDTHVLHAVFRPQRFRDALVRRVARQLPRRAASVSHLLFSAGLLQARDGCIRALDRFSNLADR